MIAIKTTANTLHQFIRETLYLANAPARLGLPSVSVDADSTNDAGRKAAQRYADNHGVRGIDPFTIDVKQADDERSDNEGVSCIRMLGHRVINAIEAIRDMILDPVSWDANAIWQLALDITDVMRSLGLYSGNAMSAPDVDAMLYAVSGAHSEVLAHPLVPGPGSAWHSDVIDALHAFDEAGDKIIDDTNAAANAKGIA